MSERDIRAYLLDIYREIRNVEEFTLRFLNSKPGSHEF